MNDIYSYLYEYECIKVYMVEYWLWFNYFFLYVDLGDYVDLFVFIIEVILGKKNVVLLNEVKCDVVIIGNNEGMIILYEVLNYFYDEVKFIVICSNVIDELGYLLNNIVFFYIKDIDGVKILFVVVIVFFILFYCVLNWIVIDLFEFIKEEIEF